MGGSLEGDFFRPHNFRCADSLGTNSPSPERALPLSDSESDHMLEQHRSGPSLKRLKALARESTRPRLSDESLITGKQLRELLGCCSEMHIWRLLNEEKNQALAFPKPVKINDRNYWRLGAVREWIRVREAASQATAPDNLASRKQSRRPPTRGARRRSRAP
jgi:predicted DNA-binding transcriptional regulator AlpA